jgi:hypothetical protein
MEREATHTHTHIHKGKLSTGLASFSHGPRPAPAQGLGCAKGRLRRDFAKRDAASPRDTCRGLGCGGASSGSIEERRRDEVTCHQLPATALRQEC